MLSAALDTVTNADLAEPFTLLRTTGQQAAGGWQANQPQNITVYGTVSVAGSKELDMITEADRVHASRVFHTPTPIYTTSADLSQTSDILVWRGIRYRVMAVRNYEQRGYYMAIGQRMDGA